MGYTKPTTTTRVSRSIRGTANVRGRQLSSVKGLRAGPDAIIRSDVTGFEKLRRGRGRVPPLLPRPPVSPREILIWKLHERVRGGRRRRRVQPVVRSRAGFSPLP